MWGNKEIWIPGSCIIDRHGDCYLLRRKGDQHLPYFLSAEQGTKKNQKKTQQEWFSLKTLTWIHRVSHEAKGFALAQNWLVTLENEAFHLLKRFYHWNWHDLGAMLFLHSLLIESPGLYNWKIYPSALLSNIHWLSSSKVNHLWGLDYQTGVIQLNSLTSLLRL